MSRAGSSPHPPHSTLRKTLQSKFCIRVPQRTTRTSSPGRTAKGPSTTQGASPGMTASLRPFPADAPGTRPRPLLLPHACSRRPHKRRRSARPRPAPSSPHHSPSHGCRSAPVPRAGSAGLASGPRPRPPGFRGSLIQKARAIPGLRTGTGEPGSGTRVR